MNMRMNEIHSNSSEQKYIHLSNGLIQSLKFITHLEYDYTHVTGFILLESHTC